MSFRNYYRNLSPDKKKELSKNAGLSMQYLSHLASGYRRAGLRMIIRLEKATNGELTRAELRPDLYGDMA